jgi:tetratricopeptide (TPR) repeat protein
MMGGRSEHPYMATALINLAALLTNQGRYDEAKPLLRRAEHIQDEVLGENHPDVAVRLQAKASWLTGKGRIEEARAAQNRAEEIEARFFELNK